MPDTIIMPYRAEVRGAGKEGEKRYTVKLGGNSCLAGDFMGNYSFDKKPKIGDKIIFEDQMHYTFVKNTTFNGLRLPSLGILRENGEFEVVKSFDYSDYKRRI
jgi:carboxynorspermidine decarboxylase